MRRRREQQDAGGPGAGRLDGGPPCRSGAGVVGLVHDQQVPREVLERAQHLRALQEIERHDEDAGKRPRRNVGRERPTGPPEPGRVGDDGGESEARVQFARPLMTQPGWNDDERPQGRIARGERVQQEPGLNGFAEADGIRNQHARRPVAERRQRGFELIRQQFRSGSRRIGERAETVCTAGRPAHRVQPPPGLHDTAAAGRGDPCGTVERHEHREGGARGAGGGHAQRGAVRVGRDRRDRPHVASKPHAFTLAPSPPRRLALCHGSRLFKGDAGRKMAVLRGVSFAGSSCVADSAAAAGRPRRRNRHPDAIGWRASPRACVSTG